MSKPNKEARLFALKKWAELKGYKDVTFDCDGDYGYVSGRDYGVVKLDLTHSFYHQLIKGLDDDRDIERFLVTLYEVATKDRSTFDNGWWLAICASPDQLAAAYYRAMKG